MSRRILGTLKPVRRRQQSLLMIRWGAVMKESDKPAVVAYLSRNFGPANKFTPVRTRPAGY